VRGNPNTISSINESIVLNSISISPNPAMEYIDIAAPQKSEIEIITIHGQSIKNIVMENTHSVIDISAFAKGIYLVKIKTEKNITVKKFIKE
jgi:hypothetical protein